MQTKINKEKDDMEKDTNMTSSILEAGKGTATCSECKTNWKSHTMPMVCPFCNSRAILYVKEQQVIF